MKKDIHKVAVIVNSTVKANRERRSGVLRYFSTHKNVQLFLLEHSRSVIRQLQADTSLAGVIDIGIGPPPSFDVPVVSFENEAETSSTNLSVNIDNDAVATAAAEFLIGKGYSNFAFIPTELFYEQERSTRREQGFQRALRKKGHSAYVYTPQVKVSMRSTDKLAEMAQWLEALPKPCGVFAYADSRAQLVIDACNLAHLEVPGQINLIGVDNDIDICECCSPTLTSLWPDFEHAGILGAQLLHRKIQRERISKDERLYYGVRRIVERASTIDLRGGGRLVSLANEHIRKHYKEVLGTADIARLLNVSRRLLDLRFREITSTTVQKEIERLRMIEAERLLRTTELSALEISSLCGYKTIMAFRKAFERTFHTTSTKEFRRSIRFGCTPPDTR